MQAGIVVGSVQASEYGYRFRYCRRNLCLVGNIAPQPQRLVPRLGECVCRSLGSILVDIGNNHSRAGLGEGPCRGKTDAPRGARHEGYFALKFSAHGLTFGVGVALEGTQSKVSGLGPIRPASPLSSASMDATSSDESSKSNKSRFSSIRSRCIDFGNTMWPCRMCQRRMTWAVVFRLRAARAPMTASSSTLPCPSGLHASTAIP